VARWIWNLEHDPSAVALARREVVQAARTLTGRDRGVDLEAVELATSELVSNAVRHGRAPIELVVDTNEGEHVRVEVNDASTQLPVPRQPDERGGRGLHLVRAIAARYGWEPQPSGKTVWIELDASRRGD
jgi:anti-sigma regulatory factor (Ser/Thr protein kinase)